MVFHILVTKDFKLIFKYKYKPGLANIISDADLAASGASDNAILC
jgi:hypothetical protein